jgi:dipeptidase
LINIPRRGPFKSDKDSRLIWPDIEDYPRFVGPGRGAPEYKQNPGQNLTQPIGKIPQVDGETFGYYETMYGVVSEMGVAIGESSCSARLFGSPARGAIMSIDELSRIALERTTTARQAVQLMGDLAEEYGFYGESLHGDPETHAYPCPLGGSNEGGEVLSVADGTEGWIFTISSDGEKGAVWAARRVPDDEATVVSNMFTIREVPLDDPENYLHSKSMLPVAMKHGWWNASGLEEPFDFTAIYSGGEYHNKYYSGRRMWRALSLMSPNANLEPDYPHSTLLEKPVFPWSVKPDNLMQLADLTAIMRDVYEGTRFDATALPGGGPWGSPARMDPWLSPYINGSWERSISVFRTAFSYVIQLRGWLPLPLKAVVWFAPHAATGSVYMPLYCGMDKLPTEYSNGNPSKLDRGSAWWAHRYVANIAYGRWNHMRKDLAAAQSVWESRGLELQKQLDSQFQAKKITKQELYQKLRAFVARMVSDWWKMPDELIFKYADGYTNTEEKFGVVDPDFYPVWWLKLVGYNKGPGWKPEL